MTNKPRTLYTVILVLSLFLFLIKGIQYAVLGSYIPLVLALVICMLFYLNRKNKKSLDILIKIWALLIIIWSLLRLLIGTADQFGKELMENHLQENLGVTGSLISLLFLVVGFYLFNKKRRQQWLN
ncbi:hypothetical protein [Winogradskyella sp. MIT101101]|uniref:hypothetical protein n=1 Tax=Winogradskyella sp. MIT101101 TaxID=3098297 RepID=UPI00399B3465